MGERYHRIRDAAIKDILILHNGDLGLFDITEDRSLISLQYDLLAAVGRCNFRPDDPLWHVAARLEAASGKRYRIDFHLDSGTVEASSGPCKLVLNMKYLTASER